MTRIFKLAVTLATVVLVLGGGYYWWFAREIFVRVAAPERNVEVRVFGIGTIEARPAQAEAKPRAL